MKHKGGVLLTLELQQIAGTAVLFVTGLEGKLRLVSIHNARGSTAGVAADLLAIDH